jgi:outer membrane protein
MTKIIKIGFLLCAFALMMTNQVIAQKYGHLNSGNLLEILPEVSAADAELAALQKQMVAKGEGMAKALDTKIQAYVKQVQEKTLSPVQQQGKETALEGERQEILKYEQELTQTIQKKREELLSPILDKVNKAITEVGKENGYSMIFDISIGSILFAEDTDDVMPLVKAKLGL